MNLLFLAPDQIMATIPLLGPSHHVPSRDQRLTTGAKRIFLRAGSRTRGHSGPRTELVKTLLLDDE